MQTLLLTDANPGAQGLRLLHAVCGEDHRALRVLRRHASDHCGPQINVFRCNYGRFKNIGGHNDIYSAEGNDSSELQKKKVNRAESRRTTASKKHTAPAKVTFPHETPSYRIHACAGLVQEHDAGLPDGGNSDGQLPLVAAGQRASSLVLKVLQVQLHLFNT